MSVVGGELVHLLLIKLVCEHFSERWGTYGIETDLPVGGRGRHIASQLCTWRWGCRKVS